MRPFAMHRPALPLVSRRRLAWLLWLALVLPAAQVAASWHALSHTAAMAGTDADAKHALHQTQCDLCLVAAAVASGALPVATPALPGPAARHDVVHAAVDSVWQAPPAQAYLSRAPPFTSI